MISKNLTTFYVTGGVIFAELIKAKAQGKLWNEKVQTFAPFSQSEKDWYQSRGFNLISWGNPATYRKPKPQSLSKMLSFRDKQLERQGE